jgi:DNA-directed RNA polymerase II subunit RPB2
MNTSLVRSAEIGNSLGKSVIDTYYKKNNVMVQHHLNSFDYFVDNQIYEILEEYNSSPKNVIYAEYDKDMERYKLEYHIKFGKVYISKPVIQESQTVVRQMYPNDSRLKNLTYSSTLKVDIYHKLVSYDKDSETPKETEFTPLLQHPIGKVPVMLQSKYCVLSDVTNKTKQEMGEDLYDYGGYFIVNGNEKVVIMQEKKAENIAFIFKLGKGANKFSHKCEVDSVDESNPFQIKKTEVKLMSKDGNIGRTIKVKIQQLRQEIPLFVVFRALGITSDKEICDMILYNLSGEEENTLLEYLRPSIEEAAPIQNMQVALEYISKYVMVSANQKTFQNNKRKLWYTQDILREEFLPHVGKELRKKAYYLGYMVNKMLKVVVEDNEDLYDDRDSFLNKRVETTGSLIASLFRINFKKMMRDVENQAKIELGKRRIDDLASGLAKKIKKSTIESGIKYGLSTGSWGDKKNAQQSNRKGIAQVLNRLSYMGFMSHLRRIQAPIDKTLKNTAPRKLHNTQWGRICPAETPEGQAVGIVKNMSLTSYVTTPSSSEPVRAYLQELEVMSIEDINPADVYMHAKVFVNGDWIGIHYQPDHLLSELRNYRRSGKINIHTSISWDIKNNEIKIYTDGGRLCRPVFIVKDNKLQIKESDIEKMKNSELSWEDLLINKDGDSFIEYIDVHEENTCMIALKQEDLAENKKSNEKYYTYTHCEIDPTLIFGIMGSIIPLVERNQAPRVLFYCAQGKQAIGVYASNFENRMDTMGHVLYYPQVPLVSTDNAHYVNFNEMPAGQNVIVAIASHTGYNQEDSIIVNRSSLERGLFVSSYFRTYFAKEQKNSSTLEEEKFCKPEKYNPNGSIRTNLMKQSSSYDKLEENGFVKEGTRVQDGDVIIGKCIPLKTTRDDDAKYRDASTSVKPNESGIVDRVYIDKDGEGFKFAKVRVRTERIPQIGDKYASRHGQKGTCGITYSQEDMPFNKNGITPDIIINPHAIPSRMTIGQLIECIMGKSGAIGGYALDGTPFTRISPDDIGDILQNQCNMERYGNEVLYNGRTGEQIYSDIFMGPTYYHRLKHMVEDKMHSRSTGPYQLLTRQPAEGRARAGGLRIGEMERDAMLSHGTVQFLKERMFDTSDKYFVNICKKTGMIAPVNPSKDIYKSLYGDSNTTDFVKVQIPYATKLFIQELMTMGITTRLYTDKE